MIALHARADLPLLSIFSASCARSMATAAKFASAVSRSRSSSVKLPMWIGESTCTAPMTRCRFQSGTHIAERIPWMAIDFPPRSRASSSALEVISATCCCGDHLQNRARDRDVLLLRAVDELRQLRNGIAFFVEQDDQSALDRQVAEDDVHHRRRARPAALRSASSALATCTRTWKIFSRDTAGSR